MDQWYQKAFLRDLPPFPALPLSSPLHCYSAYNYTEGFTGKKADWLICQGQE